MTGDVIDFPKDRVPMLWARLTEINAIDSPDVPGGANSNYEEWQSIQERIAGTVATTPEGLVAQIRFLVWFKEDFEWDATCDRLVANLIAGIERLATGGAA